MKGLEKIKRYVLTSINAIGMELVDSNWAFRAGLRPDLRRIIAHVAPMTVFDVGANKGQFYRLLRESVRYRGNIVSFEPNPALGEDLRALQMHDAHWQVESVALGAAPGQLELNVSRRSDFSSFLNTTAEADTLFPMSHQEQRVRVPVITLDDYVRRTKPEGPYLLKLDTQGYDPEVLKGGQETLGRCRAILCELSVIKIYQGQADWTTTIQELNDHGFSLSGLYPVTRTKSLEVIEFDCLMIRTR